MWVYACGAIPEVAWRGQCVCVLGGLLLSLISRLGLSTNMLPLAVSDFITHMSSYAEAWDGKKDILQTGTLPATCPALDQQCLIARNASRKTSWILPLSFIILYFEVPTECERISSGLNMALLYSCLSHNVRGLQLWVDTFVSHDPSLPPSSPRTGSHNLRQGWLLPQPQHYGSFVWHCTPQFIIPAT